MSSNSPQPGGRFSIYTNALKTLSTRTKTPLPSLILSFGILHEVTAVVPLVGVFYASRAFGVGEAIVDTVIKDTTRNSTFVESGEGEGVVGWGKGKVRGWVEEGDKWAERVGRRYGIFGYEKRIPGEVVVVKEMESTKPGHRIAGDVANAVVAYGVTKALLPVRIGVSMYFAPAFSRGVLDPVRRAVIGVFRRPQP